MNQSIDLQKNISLAPLTTLRVGGRARFFVRAETERQVIDAFNFASENQIELFILGGGSNILVSDSGFDGLVLQIALKGILSEPFAIAGGLTRPGEKRIERSDLRQTSAVAGGSDPLQTIRITVSAGEDWDEFVKYCVEKDLAGIECLSGIPGFVGGTPVQNVGAYGQEVSETIVSVRCLERASGEILQLTNDDCGFGYRSSIFNTSMRDRFIVLSVVFALTRGGAPKVAYKDLKDVFGDRTPSIAEVRDAVLRIRRTKSMVIDADDPNSQSAGSFFKNPIVTKEKIAEIQAKMKIENVPHFTIDERLVKIPAAWLIEAAGFRKGYAKGNVGLSTKHSLAIVNRGNATAREIVGFMSELQLKVESDFGIELIPEPVFVGFNAGGSSAVISPDSPGRSS